MFRKKKNRAKRSVLYSCVQVTVGRGKEAGWDDDMDEGSKRERQNERDEVGLVGRDEKKESEKGRPLRGGSCVEVLG